VKRPMTTSKITVLLCGTRADQAEQSEGRTTGSAGNLVGISDVTCTPLTVEGPKSFEH
jgi:hypothetical protein